VVDRELKVKSDDDLSQIDLLIGKKTLDLGILARKYRVQNPEGT